MYTQCNVVDYIAKGKNLVKYVLTFPPPPLEICMKKQVMGGRWRIAIGSLTRVMCCRVRLNNFTNKTIGGYHTCSYDKSYTVLNNNLTFAA